MRYWRRVVYLTLLAMTVVPCVVYFLFVQNEKHHPKRLSLKRKKQRDFIDHAVYEQDTTTRKYIPPRINILKTPKTKDLSNNICVNLTTFRKQTPICIYDPNVDRMISSFVKDYGTWEPDLLNETGLILNKNPQLTFVDIGCNIGVYTLFSAKLGIRVIAVDILKSALELLHLSLIKGGLEENVTLLLNAISDNRDPVIVKFNQDNPGGSYIEGNKTTNEDSVQTLLLDDLIDLIGSNTVFLKMDIEGSEHKAILGSSQFFQRLNVEHILMEWAFHKNNENGKYIIQFLLRNGMLPYEKLSSNIQLDLKKPYFWPDNIFWRKR